MFSVHAQISLLDLNDYPVKTAYVKRYSVSVSDAYGEIVENEERELKSEYFFDKENFTIYEITFNNKGQPCSHEISKYEKNLLPISIKHTDKSGTTESIYTYSSDYKSYELKDEDGQLMMSGRIKEENGKSVILELKYSSYVTDGKYAAIKTLSDIKINDFRELSKLDKGGTYIVYYYYGGEIDSITKTTWSGKTKTVSNYEYKKDKKDSIYIYNEQGQETYYLFLLGTVPLEGWAEYTFDDNGSVVERTTFRKSDYFEDETIYKQPWIKSIYEITYVSNNPIKAPETFYDYYIKDEEPASEDKKSDDETKTDDNSNSGKMWEIAYYVDSFKDYTDENYLRLKDSLYGTFSNSATSNSKLKVNFLIDSRDDVSFMLYEYGYSQVKESKTSYSVSIKTDSGETEFLNGNMYSDRVTLDKEGSNRIFDLFSAGGTVKFYVREISDYSSSTYNFSITNDGEEFRRLAANLTTPKEEDPGR